MAGKAKRTAARMERRKQKANRKAQNRSNYSGRVGTDANKKKKGVGGRLSNRTLARCSGCCGNIGCTKCSPIARKGAQNLLVRTVGPNKADRMCEERGWL